MLKNLMIKNWVGTENNPCWVNAIYLSHFTAYNKNDIQLNSAQDRLDGLLITEPLLIKCGFINNNGWWHHPKTMIFELNQKFPEFGYWWAVRRGDKKVGYVIKEKFLYLHELQNLCAISGVFELEVVW